VVNLWEERERLMAECGDVPCPELVGGLQEIGLLDEAEAEQLRVVAASLDVENGRALPIFQEGPVPALTGAEARIGCWILAAKFAETAEISLAWLVVREEHDQRHELLEQAWTADASDVGLAKLWLKHVAPEGKWSEIEARWRSAFAVAPDEAAVALHDVDAWQALKRACQRSMSTRRLAMRAWQPFTQFATNMTLTTLWRRALNPVGAPPDLCNPGSSLQGARNKHGTAYLWRRPPNFLPGF
jgi:hypothetical protein